MGTKIHYTVGDIMQRTGFSYVFLKQFIPVPLKPRVWPEISERDREMRLAKMQFVFSAEVYEEFIQYVCKEFHRHYQLNSEIQALTSEVADLVIHSLEIRGMLKSYGSFMDLNDIATRTGYAVGSLRNKLEKHKDNDGEKYALLKLRGVTLKLVKNNAGAWVCNRLDFNNSVSQTSLKNKMFWL